MNEILTPNDQIYIGLKNQHDRFSEVYNIHRLIIIKQLSLGKTSFKTLKGFCATSDGNLASHMKTLKDNSIVKVIKEFNGNYPKTSYVLTKKGLTLFEELQSYIIQMLSTQRLSITSTRKCNA